MNNTMRHILIGLLFLLTACSDITDNIIPACNADSFHAVTMRFEGDIDRFGVNTRATTSSWDDGATVYIQFTNSNVSGYATYDKAENQWTLYYKGQLTQNQKSSCEVFYFDNPLSVSSSVVSLSSESAIYADKQAVYMYSSGSVNLRGHLEPMTGRIRFRENAGAQFSVYNLSFYDSYDLFSNTWSVKNKRLGLTIGDDGFSPYVYGFFAYEDRNLTIVNHGVQYSKKFSEDVLAVGKSGFINLPIGSSHIGWSIPDCILYITPILTYQTDCALDYVYSDSYQPNVDDWSWNLPLSTLGNDLYNRYGFSLSDEYGNFQPNLKYVADGKYNTPSSEFALRQYAVRVVSRDTSFIACKPDEYLGEITMNSNYSLEWHISGEQLKQFAIDGKKDATRAVVLEYQPSFHDGQYVPPVYLILKADVVKATKTDADHLGLCPDSNHPHAIDLGIGVKFACCNVGADSPTGYGNYYAWGETSTKSQYDWSTYKWCNGTENSMTKYCTNSSYYETVDNKTTLELADDAARVNWGGSWRMPTYEELKKLYSRCAWAWTTINNINGYRVTGSNGNSIFLPAAGFRYNTYLPDVGSSGSYWSSSLHTLGSVNVDASGLSFQGSARGMDPSCGRFNGRSVRPVYDESSSNSITITANGVSFTMIKVEGGTFQMGSTSGSDVERPVHQVTLTNDYYIGETEVTQELWTAVMGSNPSNFKSSVQLPVEKVSWDDCQTFISKLNTLTGRTFRLPTEAEWEFAARGGNASKGYTYSGSNTIGAVAWHWGNIPSQTSGQAGFGTQPVATKAPNELGIYDMSGNVFEWCRDWYDSYSSSAQTNPTGPTSGFWRVRRGGSWSGIYDDYVNACRVASRGSYAASYAFDYLGLRLAL